MKQYKLNKPYIEEIFATPDTSSRWFGYYNYDVLNQDQSKLLCNFTPVDGVAPEKGMTVNIGYYSLGDSKWHEVGTSDSWNWQQGCMAQWLPGEGERIIFNYSDGKRLKSKIIDIKSGQGKDLDYPIYGITPDGKSSITIEMERSYWCRAYHYQSIANKRMNVNILPGDGIFHLDLSTGIRSLIIPIEEIIAIDARPDFKDMKHWVEHVMINDLGTKFCFLHRFSPSYDVNLYQTRLFIADIDGSNLQLITGWDKTDLSHFGWNGEEFAIYTVENNKVASSYKAMGQNTASSNGSLKQKIFKLVAQVARILPASIRKKIKGGKSYYNYYKVDHSGKYILSFKIEGKMFNIDGHPSFSNDHNYMITDTYPDSRGFQHLIVCNLRNLKTLELGRFPAYYHKTPASCDLHPKLSKNNNYVAVDSAYNKYHHTILFRLNWDKIKDSIS